MINEPNPTVRELLAFYLEAGGDCALAEEPIDLYVNSTYIPDQLNAHYDKLWTPARMKRIVDGLAANGIGMEINNRRRIPSAAFIRRAKKAGLKFTLGTNNADRDLGRLEYSLRMIRECGLTWQDLWMPKTEIGGQRSGAR